MNEGEPSVSSSGEATRRPAVGGALLHAMDAALTAAWDDDGLVEALAHDEGLVELVVNLELAIETLRSALLRIERPDPGTDTRGKHECERRTRA